jgi:hypothetical protein
MEQYIGIKRVFAEPMTDAEAKEKGYYRGELKEEPRDGYHVKYTDNDYDSWSPKEVFEKSYHSTSELVDTSLEMASGDYKDRFKAEYKQLKIRLDKLLAMCRTWDEGKLTFKPTCPRDIYNQQISAMTAYLNVLKERAKLEAVELD